MSNTRNHARGPGQTLLGVTMHESLKAKIKLAADIEERRMADWARIVLRDAADRVISEASKKEALPHEQTQKPLAIVAEEHFPQTSSRSIPAHGAQPQKYPQGLSRKKKTS